MRPLLNKLAVFQTPKLLLAPSTARSRYVGSQDKISVLCQMPETVRDEDDSLAAFVLTKSREELEFALWVQRRGWLVGDEKPDISTHEPHEHS